MIEITQPAVDGDDLVYHYKLIEGSLPKTGGASALFIDWVAVEHGYGYPRAGVGYRGPVVIRR